MPDPKEIAARLRELASGRIEWRVMNPKDGAYCIAFDYLSNMHPEREAREWLACTRRYYPDSPEASYEVAVTRVFTELERAALKAADALDAAAALGALSQQTLTDQGDSPPVGQERQGRG